MINPAFLSDPNSASQEAISAARREQQAPQQHSYGVQHGVAVPSASAAVSAALSYAAGPGTKRNLDFRALFCDESRATDLDCDTHTGSAPLLAITAGTPGAAHLGGLDGAAVRSVRNS